MSRPGRHPAARYAAVGLAYLALALLLTWPLALHLTDATPGVHGVDGIDTAWLRLAVGRGLLTPFSWPWSTEIYPPTGYPLGYLVPNWLDHITAAPLVLLLPWPLSDNLWWLGALTANGLAGHVLGRQVGGSHAAGWLCGVAFASAEPVLREANFGHAPQMLVCFAPLFLAALLRTLSPAGRWRDGALTGAFLALCALTYWYQAMFFGALSLPVLAHGLWRRHLDGGLRGAVSRLGLGAVVSWVLIAAPLVVLGSILSNLPRAQAGALPDLGVSIATASLAPEHVWTFAQSASLDWPLRTTPGDTTNRLSLALLGAAFVGGLATPRGRRWPWLAAAGIGAVMILGPYLKWGSDPILVGGWAIPGPWYALAAVSETLGRFHWPQRWGIVIPLALLPLAARARAPLLWSAAIVLECLVLSVNAPLHLTPLSQFEGWRALSGADGAVLVVPLVRRGARAPQLGYQYRAAGVPLATTTVIPEGAPRAVAWDAWREASPFGRWLTRGHGGAAPGPVPVEAIDDLRRDGIVAIAVDATPGGLLEPRRREQLVAALSAGLDPVLGAAHDHGSVVVWWITPPDPIPPPLPDPQAWRAAREAELRDYQDAGFRSLLQPVRFRVTGRHATGPEDP